MMANSSHLTGKKIVVQASTGLIAIHINRALTMAGCVFVGRATHGRETAEVVRRTKPDLVLVDIESPETDSLGAIARAVEESAVCQVIVTVKAQGEAEEQARSLGASGYVCKPFTSDTLVSSLEQALQNYYECAV